MWANIVKLCQELKPDFFVFGGDNMNMDSVDHWLHDKGDKRHLEGKRLKNEYLSFQADILDTLKLPKHCRKIYLLGNHEDWLEKHIDKMPEMEGFAEIERNLDLKEWEIYKYGKCAKVGKIYFHHGEYVNKYSSAKTVDTFGRNIVYGHGHTLQVYTKITPIDAEAHCATQMPCACDLNPEFMRNRPSAWLNGFGVFYIHPNGNFNIYPIVASGGHFVFNGSYY